jgi:hypothetical protein
MIASDSAMASANTGGCRDPIARPPGRRRWHEGAAGRGAVEQQLQSGDDGNGHAELQQRHTDPHALSELKVDTSIAPARSRRLSAVNSSSNAF